MAAAALMRASHRAARVTAAPAAALTSLPREIRDTQPCQGIFLLDAAVSGQMASGRPVSWHCGHAGCQGTEHRSKYSCRIRKHAAGSRHSDSVQFYSLYLMYMYICYYHTSRGNIGKLANTTRHVEYDVMIMTR